MKNETFPAADAVAMDPLGSLAFGLRAGLAETRSTIESSFSATGDSLIECTMSLNAVSAAHEGLPGALDGEQFAQAEASLASISHELARISGSDFGEDAAIDRLRQMAAGMADPLAELRRVMLLLEIISANAGILSAEVSSEDDGLKAFTGDMIALAHNAIDGISTFAHSRAALIDQLSSATAAGARFAAAHADTLEHVQSRFTEHAEAIARYRLSGGRQLSENGAVTRRIATRVADVVSAMQVGDITRQRIEHVERGLETLAEIAQSHNIDEMSQRAATMAKLCQLAGAQLRDAIGEYRDRTRFIAESLPQLANDTDRVLVDGDAQARALTASSGDTLAGMLTDLRKVRSLFADFRSVHGEADRLAQAVAAAMEDMVGQLVTIDRIERQIRVLSFNMAAQCNRLGAEGRAMMVITQQLRELAMRTETATARVRRLLADGAEFAAAISGRGDQGGELARLDGATMETIARIEAVSEEMRGHAAALTKHGPGALAILRRAAMSAQSLGEVIAEWDAALLAMEAAVDTKDSEGAFDPAPFAELRRGYTMDSERRIHDEICGGPDLEDTIDTAVIDVDDDPLSALF